MPLLLLLFILVPIIEIAVFIQIGDLLGLGMTLLIVFLTAIIGVNLLKQQGLRAWMDIQNSTAQGRVPALEMASAAQLLFAGGLLLTPGFVTDIIGFTLMVPAIRVAIAQKLMSHWANKVSSVSQTSFYYSQQGPKPPPGGQSHEQSQREKNTQRTIEGEFEEHND